MNPYPPSSVGGLFPLVLDHQIAYFIQNIRLHILSKTSDCIFYPHLKLSSYEFGLKKKKIKKEQHPGILPPEVGQDISM